MATVFLVQMQLSVTFYMQVSCVAMGGFMHDMHYASLSSAARHTQGKLDLIGGVAWIFDKVSIHTHT